MAMMLFASPLILLALFFGGEDSLSGYINPEVYWEDRGVAYRVETLAGFLQTPSAQPGPEIEKWVAELGAPDYADREAAIRQLADAGMTARPALLIALQSRDPEVVKRARDLLKALPAETDEDKVDPAMVLLSLSRMSDPQAREVLRKIADGPAGDLQKMAASYVAGPETDAAGELSGESVLNGFPADTRLFLELKPLVRDTPLLKTVHGASALQGRLIQGFQLFGDIKVHRLHLGLNEGAFFKENPRVTLRVEMDYDPARLATALEKTGYNSISTAPFRHLRRREVSIFMPDNRHLIAFLEFQNGTAEPADAEALWHPPKASAVHGALRESFRKLPEEFPLRGVLIASSAAMAQWQEFSPVREARVGVDPRGEPLELSLEIFTEDAASLAAFTLYAEAQLAEIRTLFARVNDQWIVPMRSAVNALKISSAEDGFRIGGPLSDEVMISTVEMVERQLQHFKQMRGRRNQIQQMNRNRPF